MSDSCYMTLSCLRKHMDHFIALGFHLDHYRKDDGAEVVELTDENANYGHGNDLPKDIPFIAEHGSGCSYGAHKIACDGLRFADIEATSDDGFVVCWDHESQAPHENSVQAIRDYLAIHATAEAILSGQLV